MARLISIISALSALTPSAFAAPQIPFWAPPNCDLVRLGEYQVTDVSEPFYTKPEPVGGATCPMGEKGSCEHQQSFEHSVGVSWSIGGGLDVGLDLGKIFSLGVGVTSEYTWSTEDAVAVASYPGCPEPDEGTYICGMQMRPKKIKIKGKVERLLPTGCTDNKKWVDFEVIAPAMTKGGPNEDANVQHTIEACVVSCPDDANSLDCPGVKSILDKDVPLCPETNARFHYEPGWCTGHITQHQRWQGVVGDRFKFSVRLFDDVGTKIYDELYEEVDGEGVLDVKAPALPHHLLIKTGPEDNDFVDMCYAGECWSCDDDNGGGHLCTLGDGQEHGYENNKREGDFGFTC